jgi:5,10-methylene-tetrahydrofolate dehydrogenase/methenyl tetrahydrofolate cyclohydrolase
MELLRREGLSLKGKHAVVIGNSNAVGMPLSSLLRDAGAASVQVSVVSCLSICKMPVHFTKQTDDVGGSQTRAPTARDCEHLSGTS